MNNKAMPIILCSAALALSGCETAPTKEEQGVLIGAIAGGLLGYQIGDGSGQVIATFLGTVAGAAIGGSVGRSMDQTDQLYASVALENVRTGVPTAWVNPDTGHEYTITPTNTYDSGTGPCREYTLNANIGGKPEQIYGTACRQADGSWRIVE